jgi:hypothetical protein
MNKPFRRAFEVWCPAPDAYDPKPVSRDYDHALHVDHQKRLLCWLST